MLQERAKGVVEGPIYTPDGNPYNYVVIIDSGSSGSRVYVYHYSSVAKDSTNYFNNSRNETKYRPFPHVSSGGNKWRKKVRPGIAKFVGQPDKVHQHLEPLVEFAQKVIPKEQRHRTPVFLHATGGVRLLKKSEQHELLTSACEYVKSSSDLYLPDCETHFTAITGQSEGIFGWLGINYLIGGLDDPASHDHGKNHHTYGFLDMGGASTQIAFIPNTTEIDHHKPDLFKVSLTAFNSEDDQVSDIYSESFNGLGVNEARRTFLTTSDLKKNENGELEDPCSPKGLKSRFSKRHEAEDGEEHEHDAKEEEDSDDEDSDDEDKDEDEDSDKADKNHKSKDKGKGKGKDYNKDPEEDPNAIAFIGTGDYEQCSKLISPMLDDIKNSKSPDFDFEVNHFVGVSEYWDTSEGFEMGGNIDFEVLEEKVEKYCNTDWETIDAHHEEDFPNVKEKELEKLCFESSWLLGVINEGFNFPLTHINHSDNHDNLNNYMHPLQSVEEINGVEYSWTLGRALLYASSELGANGKKGGIQRNAASVRWEFGREDKAFRRPVFKGSNSGDDDWYDDLDSHSHRLVGSLFFLGCLVLIFYLVLGKKKRNVIIDSMRTRIFGRRVAGKYSFVGSHDSMALGAADYELGDVDHGEDDFHVSSDEEIQV